MAMFLAGIFSFVFSLFLIAMWAGFDLMFGIGFTPEAAVGLALVLTSAGTSIGGALTVIWS